jgi:hypothetical protein
VNELWFSVGTPALVSIATLIYTVGGRAALARRAIEHDLRIAEMLPAGVGATAMKQMAEERAVLYVSRWVGPQPLSGKQHGVLLGTALGGAVLVWASLQALPLVEENDFFVSVTAIVALIGMAALAAGITTWVTLIFLADASRTRFETLQARHERLRRYLDGTGAE